MISQSIALYLKALCVISMAFSIALPGQANPVDGWLHWRGPNQNGTSEETGVAETISLNDESLLWTYEISGRGTPVIANGRVYAWGYRGTGPDLREYLVALDEKTGDEIWSIGFNDFISDIVYSRYSIGSPTIDPETGNIFLHSTAGLVFSVSPDGEILWKFSMMERYGRLTFPNGRVGAPVIEGDLVILHFITSNWGADGPGRNRFYAFDKYTGELVWWCTPGIAPYDSSFASPVFEWRNGKRLMYAGTGCGNLVCIDALSGEPQWRYQMSIGGVNSSALLYGDSIIAIHGVENIDSSAMGRMVSLRLDVEPQTSEIGAPELDVTAENWRAPLEMFSSSPTLVGGRIFQVVKTGELVCVDADTGQIHWSLKLANSQLHASPLYADGKLFVPMESGDLYIIRPGDTEGEILHQLRLEGNLLGSPALWDGRLYQFSTQRLYVFDVGSEKVSWPTPEPAPEPGEPAQLRIRPAEFLLSPGQTQSFRVELLDANGVKIEDLDSAKVEWASYIPPTARVRSEVDGAFNERGELVIPAAADISAGAFLASYNGVSNVIRGRVIPSLPYEEDFEGFELNESHPQFEGMQFAYPPLPWIGARAKWEIHELDGDKVLYKTIDNMLFQRAVAFIGDPESSNYTIQADVMTEGSRRSMSAIGVINHRYIIALVGNWQELEVSSNHERIKEGVSFTIRPNQWYTIKARVDLNDDGSGVVRGKAWPRDEDEPSEWTIEVEHQNAHPRGAPGIFGFSPQNQHPVYIDNILVTPNH